MDQSGNVMSAKTLGKSLGERIALHRKRIGLTQAELAEILGVESESISRFERGSTLPSLLRLFDIAHALGVGVGEILGEASPLRNDINQTILSIMKELNTGDKKLLIDIAMVLQVRSELHK